MDGWVGGWVFSEVGQARQGKSRRRRAHRSGPAHTVTHTHEVKDKCVVSLSLSRAAAAATAVATTHSLHLLHLLLLFVGLFAQLPQCGRPHYHPPTLFLTFSVCVCDVHVHVLAASTATDDADGLRLIECLVIPLLLLLLLLLVNFPRASLFSFSANLTTDRPNDDHIPLTWVSLVSQSSSSFRPAVVVVVVVLAANVSTHTLCHTRYSLR